ncbi:MAG: CCA tRNA nucleotidyltransferase, partial [Cyanobacteria bacterium J06638_6]
PLDGCADLARKTLCMVAPDNLADDPLRLLRAYRQAAQLGFSLDPDTQRTIRTLAPALGRMAAERVRGEIDCLLSLPEGSVLLSLAWQDGLLQTWLPDIGCPELERLATLDQLAAQYHERWPAYSQLLHSWIKEQTTPGLHRSWLKATKLGQLLPSDLSAAEVTLAQLKYSRAEQQAVLSILKGWQYLCQYQGSTPLAPGTQYQLFKVAGAGLGGVALMALAQGLPETLILPLVERYLTPNDPIAHPQPLITGKDLVQGLALKPGPQIGELLEALAQVQAEGLVSSRDEALTWVMQQL